MQAVKTKIVFSFGGGRLPDCRANKRKNKKNNLRPELSLSFNKINLKGHRNSS